MALCSASGYMGCAAPKPCTITPVDIEEIKSDIRDLDAKITEDRTTLARLRGDVRVVQAQIAEKRAEIPFLEAELDSVKKASGMTVTPPLEIQPAADSTAGALGGGR